MRNKNFMNDEVVYKAYHRWINSPTLFGHPKDRENFYCFVISCVRYVKDIKFVTKKEAWKNINMDILKEHLESDLAELRAQNYAAYAEKVHEILVNFETLLEYEKTRYSRGSETGLKQ